MEQHTQAAPVTVAGMEDHGWSNSPGVPGEPANVHPEVTPEPEWVPGQSNTAAVTQPATFIGVATPTTDDNGDALPPTGQMEPGHSNTGDADQAAPASETVIVEAPAEVAPAAVAITEPAAAPAATKTPAAAPPIQEG